MIDTVKLDTTCKDENNMVSLAKRKEMKKRKDTVQPITSGCVGPILNRHGSYVY
jgi:hypothetical protein